MNTEKLLKEKNESESIEALIRSAGEARKLSTLPPSSLRPMKSMIKIRSLRPDISPIATLKSVKEDDK